MTKKIYNHKLLKREERNSKKGDEELDILHELYISHNLEETYRNKYGYLTDEFYDKYSQRFGENEEKYFKWSSEFPYNWYFSEMNDVKNDKNCRRIFNKYFYLKDTSINDPKHFEKSRRFDKMMAKATLKDMWYRVNKKNIELMYEILTVD